VSLRKIRENVRKSGKPEFLIVSAKKRGKDPDHRFWHPFYGAVISVFTVFGSYASQFSIVASVTVVEFSRGMIKP